MSRITTTVALLLLATAACGQAKEDAGDGKQLDKQTMEPIVLPISSILPIVLL